MQTKGSGMDDILEILANDARVSPDEIARMTGKKVADVKKAIKKYEDDGTIIKYKAVLDPDKARGETSWVRAIIEVSVVPQKDVGFDTVAERIYSFRGDLCYLVSGTYDLLVVVEEKRPYGFEFCGLKLSPMDGVRGTSTHFC